MAKQIDMDRRELAKAAFLGAAAVVAVPAAAQAQAPAAAPAAAAGPYTNVVFTDEDPGHWAKGKGVHIPTATVEGSTLTIKTPHPMSAAHFIVSHSVVLAGGQYLSRKTFTPADMPESTHTLPAGYKGKVTITSTCNLHDIWAATITV